MEKSEQINELAAALAKAQGQIKNALKTSDNPHFGSKYADLSEVWDAIRKPLADNNLCVVQSPSAYRDEKGRVHVTVETLLMHASGQWLSSSITMVTERDTPIAIGSCITYGRRYTIQSIAGTVGEVDDDGSAASGLTEKPKAPAQKVVLPKPETKAVTADPIKEGAALTVDECKELHVWFRGILPEDERGAAADMLADYLKDNKYTKDDGKPSTTAIPRVLLPEVKKQLTARFVKK